MWRNGRNFLEAMAKKGALISILMMWRCKNVKTFSDLQGWNGFLLSLVSKTCETTIWACKDQVAILWSVRLRWNSRWDLVSWLKFAESIYLPIIMWWNGEQFLYSSRKRHYYCPSRNSPGNFLEFKEGFRCCATQILSLRTTTMSTLPAKPTKQDLHIFCSFCGHVFDIHLFQLPCFFCKAPSKNYSNKASSTAICVFVNHHPNIPPSNQQKQKKQNKNKKDRFHLPKKKSSPGTYNGTFFGNFSSRLGAFNKTVVVFRGWNPSQFYRGFYGII